MHSCIVQRVPFVLLLQCFGINITLLTSQERSVTLKIHGQYTYTPHTGREGDRQSQLPGVLSAVQEPQIPSLPPFLL